MVRIGSAEFDKLQGCELWYCQENGVFAIFTAYRTTFYTYIEEGVKISVECEIEALKESKLKLLIDTYEKYRKCAG